MFCVGPYVILSPRVAVPGADFRCNIIIAESSVVIENTACFNYLQINK